MSDGEVVEPRIVPGETTPTGAPKEKFGHGRAANAEAGAKGAEISMSRPKEAVQEASRKAARTRAERYGQQLHVSDPERDDLQDVPTTVKDTVGEVDVAASEKY